MGHFGKHSYTLSFFNFLCLQAIQYLIVSVQLALTEKEK